MGSVGITVRVVDEDECHLISLNPHKGAIPPGCIIKTAVALAIDNAAIISLSRRSITGYAIIML